MDHKMSNQEKKSAMRKPKIYKFLLVALLATGLYACEKMMDIHSQYIRDGETVYLVKPYSVESFAGNNRVLIQCRLVNAYNVDKIWVYWNSHKDSTSFDYQQSVNGEFLNLMINGLEEKSYIFEMYTKNSDGNRSVKVTTFAAAYGEKYRRSLYPRIVNGFSADTLNATMSWLASDESEDVTEIRYTATDGIEKTVSIATDTSKVQLDFFSDKGAVAYRSHYKPEVSSIDSFATDWTTFALPPAFSIFKTVSVTARTGGATLTWDNPLNVPVSVKVQYLSDKGVLTTKIFKTSPAIITALNTNPREFKVTVIDPATNSFGPKVFKVTPL